MDLTEAYDISQQADSLVLKRQYKDASQLYKQASDLFSENIDKTTNKEINNALRILAEDHQRRHLELCSLENIKAPKKSLATAASGMTSGIQSVGLGSGGMQSANKNISTSLAMARGIPGPSLDNLKGSVEDIDGMGSGGDPVQKLTVQLYNLLKAPKLNHVSQQTEMQVKPSGKSIEELEYESQSLKLLVSNYAENLQIYESFNKKTSRDLQVYLNNFKKEYNARESRKVTELQRIIEQLQKENKDLTAQTEKLKQRWDELVESAKKRREESGANSAGTKESK